MGLVKSEGLINQSNLEMVWIARDVITGWTFVLQSIFVQSIRVLPE